MRVSQRQRGERGRAAVHVHDEVEDELLALPVAGGAVLAEQFAAGAGAVGVAGEGEHFRVVDETIDHGRGDDVVQILRGDATLAREAELRLPALVRADGVRVPLELTRAPYVLPAGFGGAPRLLVIGKNPGHDPKGQRILAIFPLTPGAAPVEAAVRAEPVVRAGGPLEEGITVPPPLAMPAAHAAPARAGLQRRTRTPRHAGRGPRRRRS